MFLSRRVFSICFSVFNELFFVSVLKVLSWVVKLGVGVIWKVEIVDWILDKFIVFYGIIVK